MAHGRSRFPGRSSGQRRLVQWIGPADQAFIAVASAGATLIGSASFTDKATIVRTRGGVRIQAQVATADVAIVGAFGVGIVSADALAVGITAIPGPFRDADWSGWYVWRSFSDRLEFQSASGTRFLTFGFEVDSKAMRKVGPLDALVIVAESQIGAFSISAPIRTLAKLP